MSDTASVGPCRCSICVVYRTGRAAGDARREADNAIDGLVARHEADSMALDYLSFEVEAVLAQPRLLSVQARVRLRAALRTERPA